MTLRRLLALLLALATLAAPACSSDDDAGDDEQEESSDRDDRDDEDEGDDEDRDDDGDDEDGGSGFDPDEFDLESPEGCADALVALMDGVDFDDDDAVAAMEADFAEIAGPCGALDPEATQAAVMDRVEDFSDEAYEYLFEDGSDVGEDLDDVDPIDPVASVAGEPCVALSDPLPSGAPDVPVPVGDPPAELVVEDLAVGDGDAVPPDATVTVDYIGVSCSTGVIFDNSYDRGQPATFPLSGVIEGWTTGLVGMREGGTRLLVIPPDLAYGDAPTSPDIAPGETLVFVVELIEVG